MAITDNMDRPRLAVSLSVVKREPRSISEVKNKFTRDGWQITDSLFNGRVVYLEKSGINITLIQMPFSTLIVPSGPVRGLFFGENVGLIRLDSSIGAGAKTSEKKKKEASTSRTTRAEEILE